MCDLHLLEGIRWDHKPATRTQITPILGMKLPVGTYMIIAINKEQGLQKTFRVTIRPKKTTTVFKKLSP